MSSRGRRTGFNEGIRSKLRISNFNLVRTEMDDRDRVHISRDESFLDSQLGLDCT
ncbi:hypothetical protein BDR03DRAFT_943320 [Suillus americanus]|nr:hypothetical protein BDR03DRAFT_943320 [Suillus americanus]